MAVMVATAAASCKHSIRSTKWPQNDLSKSLNDLWLKVSYERIFFAIATD